MAKGSDVLKELADLGVTGANSKPVAPRAPRVLRTEAAVSQETVEKLLDAMKRRIGSLQVLEGFAGRIEALELALTGMLEWCAEAKQQLSSCDPKQSEEAVTSSRVEEIAVEASTEHESTEEPEKVAEVQAAAKQAAVQEPKNDEVQGQEGDGFSNPAWIRQLP
jgi:hypothetical protein